jgi:hypothetical protein
MHISSWASIPFTSLVLAGYAFATAPAFAADSSDNQELAT